MLLTPLSKLSTLSPEELLELQNAKLRYLMQYQIPYHPYYAEKFQELGIDPSEIQTIADLRKLPFTSKEDIAPTDEDPARSRRFILQPTEELIKKHAPKGQLLSMLGRKLLGRDVKQRLEWEYKPVHTHFTTGRSAAPTAFVYSQRDVQLLRETGARLFEVTGMSRDDKAINGFPYAPHLAFWLAYHALMQVGMTSVQTGGGKTMGTEKIINLIERLQPQILIFIPGYAYHLLRTATKQGRNFSSIKLMVFGGERVSPGLRDKTHELLQGMGAQDVKVLTTYAFTEAKTAWIQCDEKSGYHLNPDVEHIELVDEQGNPVLEDQPGEVVYTSLDWRGSMVLRYRTGDMCQGINYGPCPYCGRNLPRLHYDIQRRSEHREFRLTNVKGTLVNLNAFFPLLSGMREVEEWQVELRKKNDEEFGLDEIVIKVALKSGEAFEDVKHMIQQRVASEIEISPEVELVSMTTLLAELGMETELKEKRIVDKRSR